MSKADQETEQSEQETPIIQTARAVAEVYRILANYGGSVDGAVLSIAWGIVQSQQKSKKLRGGLR